MPDHTVAQALKKGVAVVQGASRGHGPGQAVD